VGLITWIVNRLAGDPIPTEVEIEEFFNLQAELVVRNLAFYSAINLISKSISKCEFKTYFKNEEVKKEEYYMWNIEPNKNQNSTQFITKLITKLYENNECLVIESNGQLLVADTFYKKEFALFENQFTSVMVNGFEFNKTFSMSEVLYFKLNNEDVRKLINGMYESYGKLITYAQKSYEKSRGNRGILDINGTAQGNKNFNETFGKLMNQKFKTFFESNNAVLPLFDGYSYTDIGSKTYSNEGTRDIKAMVDDIYDFTGRAIGTPPILLKGEVSGSKDAVDNLLTFCIDPLVDMMQEEINRKRSGYLGYSKGTFIKIDTKTIKHIDLLSVSTSIDKLISSGAFCVNDIRKLVGEEIIDEPWAWEHYMTKNYAAIEELMNSLKGGDGE